MPWFRLALRRWIGPAPILAAIAGAIALVTFTGAGTASAHAGLDSSTPADGAVLPDPVGEITVVFTESVTLVGNGFEVLDPQGRIVAPDVVTDDGVTFRLRLDPALGGGDAGVRYEATSADGHAVSGAFSFTVEAPLEEAVDVEPSAVATETAPVADADVATADVATDDAGRPGLVIAPVALIALGAGSYLLYRSRASG